MIHIFHTWSKWSDIEIKNTIYTSIFPEDIELVQKRFCNKCNKIEIRTVK